MSEHKGENRDKWHGFKLDMVFQRTDAFLRNEWSNYTNWPYSDIPNKLVDSLDYNDVPASLPNVPEYYEVDVSFLGM